MDNHEILTVILTSQEGLHRIYFQKNDQRWHCDYEIIKQRNGDVYLRRLWDGQRTKDYNTIKEQLRYMSRIAMLDDTPASYVYDGIMNMYCLADWPDDWYRAYFEDDHAGNLFYIKTRTSDEHRWAFCPDRDKPLENIVQIRDWLSESLFVVPTVNPDAKNGNVINKVFSTLEIHNVTVKDVDISDGGEYIHFWFEDAEFLKGRQKSNKPDLPHMIFRRDAVFDVVEECQQARNIMRKGWSNRQLSIAVDKAGLNEPYVRILFIETK